MLSEDLREKVLNLKPLEKIRLVEFILESLDKPDTTVQEKWIEESEKRFDAFPAGKIQAVSYEDILKRLGK